MRKSNSRRSIVLLFALFLGGASVVHGVPTGRRQTARAAASGYVGGVTAKLSAAQVGKLLRLNAPIAVPTLVPSGFRVSGVSATRDTKTSPGFAIIDYRITYNGPGRKSFSIVSANEGIGDLFLAEQTLTGSNAYFEHGIEVGYMDDDVDGIPQKTVASQWMSSRRRYELKKGALSTQMYHFVGHGITPREALAIMESLRYLKR